MENEDALPAPDQAAPDDLDAREYAKLTAHFRQRFVALINEAVEAGWSRDTAVIAIRDASWFAGTPEEGAALRGES